MYTARADERYQNYSSLIPVFVLQGQLREISTSILILKRLVETKGINEVTASASPDSILFAVPPRLTPTLQIASCEA